MLQSIIAEAQAEAADDVRPARPIGATAASLYAEAQKTPGQTIIFLAQTSRRARDLIATLEAFDPGLPVAYFPSWDCLPYDGLSPSRAVMGQRMGVLRWLTNPDNRPHIVVSTAEAVMRRVPPRAIWEGLHREFRVGDAIDLPEIEAHLRGIGYVFDDRVDEPGEAAIRGLVIDLFPAGASFPCRIEHDDGRITAIRSYHPATQRTVANSQMLIVDPASEIVGDAPAGRVPTDCFEHQLSRFHGSLETLFDYAADASLIMEEGVDRAARAYRQLADDTQADVLSSGRQGPSDTVDHEFLAMREWDEQGTARLQGAGEESIKEEMLFVPRFAESRSTWKELRAYLDDHQADATIVLSTPTEALLSEWSRRAQRNLQRRFERASTWNEVLAQPTGRLLAMVLPLTEGFIEPGGKVIIVTVRDLGGQAGLANGISGTAAAAFQEPEFSIGDAVVHFDHGIGILEGLEALDHGGVTHEVIRMRYADDAMLMVPVEEIGALWRYGGEASGVTLDRLKGSNWIERRNKVLEGIRSTAGAMIELARSRCQMQAEPLRPSRARYERFCARFPYELSPDQEMAVMDVLSDLASGSSMNRLVCGDVGFGKTEVALRAAAAVAFSGRQVAIVAPTTILAQQHARTFAKRFSGFDVEVAQLSRLSTPTEAKRVKAGLADGSIQIVIGTHALCGRDISFNNLGLIVVDEEQRFGAKQKTMLQDLSNGAHLLTLTATPIPRTLQASFVGLNELSVIATPPVLRQPIQTVVAAFDETLVRDALRREHRRGGQSFVVCPRIEDIEPMAKRLAAMVPDLTLEIAHGKLAPDDVDQAMLRFTEGDGDVLLATDIIESGLDIPGANTLIVWHPDRFGLAQLHQLRGRVGRGTRRGVAYFLHEPGKPLAPETERRLKTLEAMNRLGAGFDISARDLDLRGAGELLGDDQAGHLQLIGISLYRHFLERALAVADGKPVVDRWTPDIDLGIVGRIPPDYVPEADTRINLYAAIDGVQDRAELQTLNEEIDDRFGTLPRAGRVLLDLADMRLRCFEIGVGRLSAGPKGIAATFHTREDCERARRSGVPDNWKWSENKLIFPVATRSTKTRLAAAVTLLDVLEERR